MATKNDTTPALTTEEQLAAAKAAIAKLEAESAEKDELIAEQQATIEAQDSSSLDVPAFPTVKHEGKTYKVTARNFKIKGDPKIYVLADLKDPELVAKLVAQGAGYLKAE
jgi:lipopolysaccharide export system protein LptC